jgi:beta-glucosidase
MTILDNNVEINYNEPVKDEKGNIVSYNWKTTTVPAATAVMTSFNRIGATWAGGHYYLITEVLRNEWGFNGFVLTDYEVGRGKGSYMDTLQTLAGGGDAKLKTVGMDALLGFDISKYPAYQALGREAAHHILYTVVNSAAMNGFVHVVGMTKAQVEAMPTKVVEGAGYVISADDALLSAGCTIQITSIKTVVANIEGKVVENIDAETNPSDEKNK